MDELRGDDLDQLIAGLYETALQPTLWPDWFSAAATAFGGNSGLSLVQSPRSGAVDMLGVRGLSAQAMQLYADHYHTCDLWTQRSGRTLMRATISADLCTDEEFANSEIYTDFSKPHGGGAFYVVGAVLPVAADMAVLGFQSTRSQGPFTRAHARALDRLLPHFQRALLVRAKLKEADQRSASFQSLLDTLRHGVALVALDGTLLHANLAAQELLQRRDGLSIATGGRLAACRHADTSALRALIAGCALRTGGGAVSLPRPSGAKPYEVLVVPLSTANRRDVSHKASAMVFLHDPKALVTPLPNLLASLFRLTPAEGRLATDLLGHLTLEEIAERRGLSRETLRSQLKELFRKTGTSRQSELVGQLTAGFTGSLRL